MLFANQSAMALSRDHLKRRPGDTLLLGGASTCGSNGTLAFTAALDASSLTIDNLAGGSDPYGRMRRTSSCLSVTECTTAATPELAKSELAKSAATPATLHRSADAEVR